MSSSTLTLKIIMAIVLEALVQVVSPIILQEEEEDQELVSVQAKACQVPEQAITTTTMFR